MRWPLLSTKGKLETVQDAFRGYNHNPRIGEGEFYDMENMTSDRYPLLAPRKKRGLYLQGGSIQGLIAKDALCWVDGSAFVMNGYPVELGLSTDPEDCPKQLVSMGAYVIILPDKKYINTADLTDFGNLEASFQTVNPVTFTLCNLDGVDYSISSTGSGEPDNPENLQYWVDTSAVPSVLKQWSESSSLWVSVSTTYVKIASPGIGKAFEQYDGIFLKGLTGELTDAATGEVVEDSSDLAALEGAAVIWAKGDDYIVITGMLRIARTITDSVTVSREMPAMDFVIERENRLWGCRYGLNNAGEVVNEIYCSKLGDFRNWNCFMGLSTDSYAVSLGSDGPFTGAITYAGYPLFFKENCLHKVFGDIPANFGIQTTACRGVQQGSSRSLAIVNELLYYKARHAVCVYDGSLPVEISAALGEERYRDAVAGAHGNKYYISMADAAGAYTFFVYDTAKGMWHKEDSLKAYLLCSCRDELYCALDDGRILTLLGSGEPLEEKLNWMVETGPMGVSLPDRKVLSRLNIRMALELGSSVSIWVRYDSIGRWTSLCYLTGTELRSFTVPVKPRRCDHFRLRIRGTGEAAIYSITKTIRQGSDRP